MAFQAGEIKITASIDGLSFYHNKLDGFLVRMKGGPNRKQFKTLPAFARSRENSDEFGIVSKTAAEVRKLMIKAETKVKAKEDKKLFGKLKRLMYLLQREDKASARGRRHPVTGMNTEAGRELIRNFEVESGYELRSILQEADLLKAEPSLVLCREALPGDSGRGKKRFNRNRRVDRVLCARVVPDSDRGARTGGGGVNFEPHRHRVFEVRCPPLSQSYGRARRGAKGNLARAG
jgi:hypothetical protein